MDEAARLPVSDFKLSGLLQIARRLLDGARFGLRARRTLGAREPRAGIDVRDRAVVDVAELVGLDRDRPAGELLLAPCVIFRLHAHSVRYGFSTAAPTR